MVCGRPQRHGAACAGCSGPDIVNDRVARREHDALRAQVLSEETTCYWCGGIGTEEDPLTLEHITPRARGGRSTRDNAAAAHRSCNSSHGTAVVA